MSPSVFSLPCFPWGILLIGYSVTLSRRYTPPALRASIFFFVLRYTICFSYFVVCLYLSVFLRNSFRPEAIFRSSTGACPASNAMSTTSCFVPCFLSLFVHVSLRITSPVQQSAPRQPVRVFFRSHLHYAIISEFLLFHLLVCFSRVYCW